MAQPTKKNNDSKSIKILTVFTGILTAIASLLGLFISKQNNQIILIEKYIESVKISRDSLKNQLAYLSKKDSILENRINSVIQDRSKTPPGIKTGSVEDPDHSSLAETADMIEQPAISDTLFTADNPYPQNMDKVKINDNITKIRAMYRFQNISQKLAGQRTIDLSIHWPETVFTSIGYKCEKNDRDEYFVRSIEYFFKGDTIDYVLPRCIKAYGPQYAKYHDHEERPVYEWKLENGLRVYVIRYSDTQYSYMISR